MNEEYTDYCSIEIVKKLLEIDDSLLDQRISDDADMDAWSHPEKYYVNEEYSIVYVIPTLYAVQKWLRKEKGINIDIESNFHSLRKSWYYNCSIWNIEGKLENQFNTFNTYEEALEYGINKALELI